MDWEYKSKYSYGRMISIVRRNINNFLNRIRIKYENNLYFNNDNNNSNINNINNNFLTYMENDLNLTVENIYINNINISYKNYKFNLIEKYKYIPGIIFIHNNNNNNNNNGSDNECFTGGETSNIYSHIYTFKNRLDGKINNIYKNKNDNIYNCLEIIRNKYNKEIIETIYAVINNSKFWKLIF